VLRAEKSRRSITLWGSFCRLPWLPVRRACNSSVVNKASSFPYKTATRRKFPCKLYPFVINFRPPPRWRQAEAGEEISVRLLSHAGLNLYTVAPLQLDTALWYNFAALHTANKKKESVTNEGKQRALLYDGSQEFIRVARKSTP
jgi:hypothetical protein